LQNNNLYTYKIIHTVSLKFNDNVTKEGYDSRTKPQFSSQLPYLFDFHLYSFLLRPKLPSHHKINFQSRKLEKVGDSAAEENRDTSFYIQSTITRHTEF